MTDDIFREAETFSAKDGIFGAFDDESAELLFVVEAESLDEATTHVGAVAPLLGVKRCHDLMIAQLKKIPSGVPTFLKAFFEAGKIAIKRGNVMPGGDTLH